MRTHVRTHAYAHGTFPMSPGFGLVMGRQMLADALALVKVGQGTEGWLQRALPGVEDGDGELIGWR